MKRILDSSLGRFTLEGVVVDEEGTPLDDVSLRISKENLIGFDKWKTDQEERIINGKFSVSAHGYFGIRLTFNKEGYFEESVYFSTSPPDDFRNPEEPVVDQNNIRVVLKKMGDITCLTARDFKLTYQRQDCGASGYVTDFNREKWQAYSEGRGARNPMLVTNLLVPETIPPMCVYVIPKVDEDGRILNENKGEPDWFRPCLMPQELRLITSDPEGGFIVYEQDVAEKAYWSMKLAPENGYKQEIVLDADWLFRRSPYVTSRSDDGIYFYFKINGRYGKARLGTPRFPEGDYALEVGTEFRMQIDGSRNLDTGRD